MGAVQDVAKAVPSMTITPGQAVMSWLIAQQFSVFPRTSKLGRLSENSGTTMASIPSRSLEQMESIGAALRRVFGEDDITRAEEFPIIHSDDIFSWFLVVSFLIWFGVETRAPSFSTPSETLKVKQSSGRRKRSTKKCKKTVVSKEKQRVPISSPGRQLFDVWRGVIWSSAGYPYSEKVE